MSSWKWIKTAVVLTFSVAITSGSMADAKPGIEIYGAAQVDYIQDFKRVDPAWQDALRPSKLPTVDEGFGSDGQASFSAKQSKIGIKGIFPVEGKELNTKIEFDFFGTGADEGQTTPHLLHAFGEYDAWLGGQTDTLFMDMDSFPNVIDYWGPAGMVFVRNAQIRWTPVRESSRSFAVAIEKPSDDIDAGKIRLIDPDVVADVQTNEKAPDLTARFRTSADWGHLQLAGLLRQVGFETRTTADHEPSDQQTGWGVDLTGTFKIASSGKIIFGVVTGQGIASYMNDGGTDMGPEGTVGNISAKLVPLTGMHLYYDHSWNEKWTSSLGYSQTFVDNTELQTDDAFKRGQYASVNLLTTSVKNFLTGAEFMWASRESKDGSTTDDSRIQISLKYSFSSGDF